MPGLFNSVHWYPLEQPGEQEFPQLSYPHSYPPQDGLGVQVPQTLAVPPPAQIFGLEQFPQERFPPQPLGIVPQLSGGGQVVIGVQEQVPGPLVGQVSGEAHVPQECPQGSVPQSLVPHVLGQTHWLTAPKLFVPKVSLKQQFLLKTGLLPLMSDEEMASQPTSYALASPPCNVSLHKYGWEGELEYREKHPDLVTFVFEFEFDPAP